MSHLAAFYRSPLDVVVRSSEFGPLSNDESLIAIDACGICGTDINAILRGSPNYLQVGHEIAGRVLDTDGNITDRRVVLESSSACGLCCSCRNGRLDLCTQVRSFFRKPYFGLAQKMPSPTISLVDYSELDPAVATLSEPLTVAIDMCQIAKIDHYSNVLVIGLGPIGLMAIRLAKLAGARKISAVTFSGRERRNSLAIEFGADELLYEDDVPLRERKLDPPPDKILSTALPCSLGDCVPTAAMGALLVFIGVGHGETERISLPGNEFHFKKLNLLSSFVSPALRTPIALELLRAKRVDGEKMISHRFPLSEAAEAIRVACLNKNEAIKVVVVNNGS